MQLRRTLRWPRLWVLGLVVGLWTSWAPAETPPEDDRGRPSQRVSAGGAEAASKDHDGRRPAAAFLDLDRSALGALVEERLLAGPRARWLERTEIDRVLAEQELGKLFGADAGTGRVALGRILKADLLVFLRTGKNEQSGYAELVVAETGGGLRLLVRKAPLSGPPESNADALVRLVDEAFGKYGQDITEVYAVPPFFSRDLTFEHDYLKAAYAKVTEQRLLAQPGLLVVELAEAEAIAREYQLANSGETPVRRLPLYLLGEYRHEGRGEDRQVAITLKLKRGDKLLGQTSKTVAPGDATGFLGEMAGRLAAWKDRRPVGQDAVAEARQLGQRADDFLKLGDWNEALALLEAALLLAPDDVDLRRDAFHARAVVACYHLTMRDWHRCGPSAGWETKARGLNCFVRGLRHLEACRVEIADVQRLPTGMALCLSYYPNLTIGMGTRHRLTEEMKDAVEKAQRTARETFHRILLERAKAGYFDIGDEALFSGTLDRGATAKERLEGTYKTLVEIQDYPLLQKRAFHFSSAARLSKCPEGAELVARMEQSKNEAMRAAGALVRRHIELVVPKSSTVIDAPKPIPETQPVQFQVIDFPTVTREGEQRILSNVPLNCWFLL